MENEPTDVPALKPRATLYRLIEAGQRAHLALVAPLRDRGLEPGDDAVLFVLGQNNGATEEELLEGTGLDSLVLNSHLDRLIEREFVCRRAVGAELVPGLALTDRGERVRLALQGTWTALDDALLGGLDKKERRRFDRALRRVLTLLRW